jgi:hypothetical protein
LGEEFEGEKAFRLWLSYLDVAGRYFQVKRRKLA